MFKFKKRIKEPNYTCNGKKVYMMQYYPLGFLIENQKRDWNKLVNFLNNNTIKIYCTYNSLDNFANNTLATGHIDDFINYVSQFCKEHPSDIYCLNEAGDLTLVEFE